MQPDDRGRRPNGYMASMNADPSHDATKCVNYALCGTDNLPNWWYECKGHYVCTQCDTDRLGIVQFSNGECAICMEDDVTLVMHPNCSHKSCIKCFRRLISWDHDDIYPEMPYSDEVHDMYSELKDGTPECDEFLTKYPLMVKYNRDWDAADNELQRRYEDEGNLRCCPICRSPFYKATKHDEG